MQKFIPLLGAALVVAAPAHAAERAGGSFAITLEIPEVCDIEVGAVEVDEDSPVVNTTVFEMCNSPRGFSLLASHRSLAFDENVLVSYGGASTALAAGGTMSVVGFRSGPFVGATPLSVQARSLRDRLSIGLAVTAI